MAKRTKSRLILGSKYTQRILAPPRCSFLGYLVGGQGGKKAGDPKKKKKNRTANIHRPKARDEEAVSALWHEAGEKKNLGWRFNHVDCRVMGNASHQKGGAAFKISPQDLRHITG